MSNAVAHRDPGITAAIEAAGSVRKLAALLNLSHPSIYSWSRVPAEHAVAIEKATLGKVKRHQLRPDLWPSEAA